MSDLVERLRSIADASRRDDGTDIPLGENLREAAARIEALEASLAEAITQMTEASREAGHWKGKYEAAGYPGNLDGWIERAKALEAENARFYKALKDISRQKKTSEINKNCGAAADYEGGYDICIDVARAALAEKAGE